MAVSSANVPTVTRLFVGRSTIIIQNRSDYAALKDSCSNLTKTERGVDFSNIDQKIPIDKVRF